MPKAMSGRGRGVLNTPAWMARENGGGRDGPMGGRPGPGPDFGPRGGGPFHGEGPPGGFDRGPPPPHSRDDHRGASRHGGGGRGGRFNGPPRGGFRGRRDHSPPPHRGRPPPGLITFRSFEEEQAWVEERRRKRMSRPSKFDIQPTPEQIAAQASTFLLQTSGASSVAAVAAAAAGGPQLTRHARRIYVGNLPMYVTEEMLHQEFKKAIEIAWDEPQPLFEDPILSVYINHERRFCFIEFKTVEMTTACMNLDGMIIQGMPVKVKRPNDYNELLAPKVPPSAIPQLDVSRLGIISSTVLDGPNKIFIGGLAYHLTESQVLELLQAFGKVKSFHLVMGDSDSGLSKGYCFVEYADPNKTPIAIQGLNGLDIGGGKSLTARLAGERALGGSDGDFPVSAPAPPAPVGLQPPIDKNIVAGYDIEALVDAAMGLAPMPVAPVYKDALGLPLTRIVNVVPQIAVASATTLIPASTSSVPASNGKTRILVLHNMVQPEDLATDEDHQALMEEVKEECAKFGNLISIQIPREPTALVEPSAIQKIYLEYGSQDEAEKADKELAGRQFGDNVVETEFYPVHDFAAGMLR